MPPVPHSLTEVAKKLAEYGNIPWFKVQQTYRALQALEVLPANIGRRIWFAHPNMVGELLIGVALDSNEYLKERVAAFHNAERRDGHRFRDDLSHRLTNADAAAALDSIAFEIDAGRVVVNANGKAGHFYCAPNEVSMNPAGSSSLRWRAVVPGALIQALQANVTWRTLDVPPYAFRSLADAGADTDFEGD